MANIKRKNISRTRNSSLLKTLCPLALCSLPLLFSSLFLTCSCSRLSSLLLFSPLFLFLSLLSSSSFHLPPSASLLRTHCRALLGRAPPSLHFIASFLHHLAVPEIAGLLCSIRFYLPYSMRLCLIYIILNCLVYDIPSCSAFPPFPRLALLCNPFS